LKGVNWIYQKHNDVFQPKKGEKAQGISRILKFLLYIKRITQMKQGKDVLIYLNYQPFEQCGLLLTK